MISQNLLPLTGAGLVPGLTGTGSDLDTLLPLQALLGGTGSLGPLTHLGTAATSRGHRRGEDLPLRRRHHHSGSGIVLLGLCHLPQGKVFQLLMTY